MINTVTQNHIEDEPWFDQKLKGNAAAKNKQVGSIWPRQVYDIVEDVYHYDENHMDIRVLCMGSGKQYKFFQTEEQATAARVLYFG